MLKGFQDKKMGLLGAKLGHSFSPLIHQKLADYQYKLYEVREEELESFLRAGEFDGLNVTIPYKKTVMPCLDYIAPQAEKIGAINTIKKMPDGSLAGYNTDYDGFMYLLKKNGIAVSDKKVLVLGSGGASAPVRLVLQELGAREIVTISRTGENNYRNIAKHYDAQVIINTTPVGMYPQNGETVIDIGQFKRCESVVDIIYNPLRTKLILDAQERGIKAVGGLEMLVGQAKRSCEIWCGEAIADEQTELISRLLYARQQNIVFIGMPGSGKSTLSRALAQELGRELVDIDQWFLEYYHRSAEEVINTDGEEKFRAMEHFLVNEAGKKSGVVISTGGGVVTREENYQPLKQNGLLLLLERPIEKLPKDGRPISQRSDLHELYAKRLPMYRRFADKSVAVDDDAAKSLQKVLAVLQEAETQK